jgi:hypothetical protein
VDWRTTKTESASNKRGRRDSADTDASATGGNVGRHERLS